MAPTQVISAADKELSAYLQDSANDEYADARSKQYATQLHTLQQKGLNLRVRFDQLVKFVDGRDHPQFGALKECQQEYNNLVDHCKATVQKVLKNVQVLTNEDAEVVRDVHTSLAKKIDTLEHTKEIIAQDRDHFVRYQVDYENICNKLVSLFGSLKADPLIQREAELTKALREQDELVEHTLQALVTLIKKIPGTTAGFVTSRVQLITPQTWDSINKLEPVLRKLFADGAGDYPVIQKYIETGTIHFTQSKGIILQLAKLRLEITHSVKSQIHTDIVTHKVLTIDGMNELENDLKDANAKGTTRDQIADGLEGVSNTIGSREETTIDIGNTTSRLSTNILEFSGAIGTAMHVFDALSTTVDTIIFSLTPDPNIDSLLRMTNKLVTKYAQHAQAIVGSGVHDV